MIRSIRPCSNGPASKKTGSSSVIVSWDRALSDEAEPQQIALNSSEAAVGGERWSIGAHRDAGRIAGVEQALEMQIAARGSASFHAGATPSMTMVGYAAWRA